ncbi:hypothetical protein GCM10008174_03930 [Methylopila turkensis]|uniref:Uncharacterized protein n=1 Tax=Methylopila turkensis TaxID=1437816 RepID=A0A9W6JKD9_9HYPH|nr:hypothetical protein GCM10008174_03930 [Methylopila turkensis]
MWATALVGFLTPIVLLAPFNPAKAGFLDWLFGRRPAATQQAAHPDVTIAPRQKVRTAAKPVPQLSPAEILARTIDPKANPDWHLIDPTLRNGDILFLADRVLVFKGGATGVLANYVPVGQSRLVSAKDRRLIQAMAGGRIAPTRAATRLASTTATKAGRQVAAAR